MDPQSLTILVGAFQRILSILIGGMLIYFGYRLFLSLPGKRGRDGGSGEFSLGGANKVKLSKVGPGVFFAVFGAGLIAYSFAKPMKVNIPAAAQTAPTATTAPSAGTGVVAAAGFSYVGAVSAPETDEDRARMRNETQQDIIILNRALDGANASERPQVERAVVRAKVALMEPLWAEDWGELKDFRDWLAKGGTPPDKTRPAVDYFQGK
ncbi:MAG: hypothetical protein DME75_13645 [Verrucomicrobia bacterium]|nr:MAG: hypothetical protein DME75_13645 [Verrucomicrobiota bacterium]